MWAPYFNCDTLSKNRDEMGKSFDTTAKYFQRIKEGDGYDVTIGKRSYFIRYVELKGGVVYVPSDKESIIFK